MPHLLVCCRRMGCQVSPLDSKSPEGSGRGCRWAVGVGCNLPSWRQPYRPGYRILLFSTVRKSGCISEMSQIHPRFEYLWSHLHNVDARLPRWIQVFPYITCRSLVRPRSPASAKTNACILRNQESALGVRMSLDVIRQWEVVSLI